MAFALLELDLIVVITSSSIEIAFIKPSTICSLFDAKAKSYLVLLVITSF